MHLWPASRSTGFMICADLLGHSRIQCHKHMMSGPTEKRETLKLRQGCSKTKGVVQGKGPLTSGEDENLKKGRETCWKLILCSISVTHQRELATTAAGSPEKILTSPRHLPDAKTVRKTVFHIISQQDTSSNGSNTGPLRNAKTIGQLH